jgi:tripartite-type tricarboxylate transporter receptor subunit TctC
MRRIAIALSLTIASALLLRPPGPAAAQTYPNKPIRLIVSSAAGGPLDIVARTVGDKLSAGLKQPVVVESRAGAGGNLAAEAVSKAPPDGYTLLFVLSTTLTVNPHLYKGLTFNLRPISVVNYSTQMLVVHPSVPVKTVPEFVAWAKNEGPVTYGHAGNGSPSHLVMEDFRLRAGFETIPVPYRGAAPLAADLISGQYKGAFGSTANLLPLVATGKLRPIAVSTAERSPLAPDVPTIAESGFPGFNLTTDFILMAPAGTPDDIVALLERETRQGMTAQEVRDALRKQDIWIIASTPAEAEARVKAGFDHWGDVVRRTGMKVD